MVLGLSKCWPLLGINLIDVSRLECREKKKKWKALSGEYYADESTQGLFLQF